MTKNKNPQKINKKITKKLTPEFVAGVDEVGRGPVAGPVTVCVVLMSESVYKVLKKSEACEKLRDSKALSEKKREEWFEKIKQWRSDEMLDFSFHSLSAKDIDNFGISSAIQKCLNKNLQTLKVSVDTKILLDGGLVAPDKFTNQKTIIKGDTLEPIISLASIVAKVSRDNYMKQQAVEYPEYGFEKHKGYGTKAHMEAIEKYGLSNFHRKSFLKKFL